LDTDTGILLPPWEVASTSTSGLTPGQTPDITYRQTVSRLPTSGLHLPYRTRHRLLLGDTPPTTLDNYTAQPEVASRHPDIVTNVATHLPHEPDNHRLTSEPDNSLPFHITGSRAFNSVHEDPRPTMGNGVSGDQGNLPAHGKRDVREGLGAERHDWSEQARAREIVTPPPNLTAYTSTDLSPGDLPLDSNLGPIRHYRLALAMVPPAANRGSADPPLTSLTTKVGLYRPNN